MHAGACNIIHAAKTGAGHNTHTEQHYGGFHVRLNICNLYTAIQTRYLSLVWRGRFDRAARADLLLRVGYARIVFVLPGPQAFNVNPSVNQNLIVKWLKQRHTDYYGTRNVTYIAT